MALRSFDIKLQVLGGLMFPAPLVFTSITKVFKPVECGNILGLLPMVISVVIMVSSVVMDTLIPCVEIFVFSVLAFGAIYGK